MRKLLLFFLAILLLAGCSNLFTLETDTPPTPTGLLEMHFMDVGQGDAILAQLPSGKTMLVDAGTNGSAEKIINYLTEQGVKKLDYLVGTHPHEDHIGAMDEVVKRFEIGEVFMPKATTTTKTFRDLLAALQEKELQVTTAKAGVKIVQEDALSIDIVGPCSDSYERLNNYSVVLKITFGEVAFLLTGDAETLAEKELLADGADIQAQVLKVGHHGSETSTSVAFLQTVNPEYAVISVGKKNSYNHPHQVILDRLDEAGVTVLRTDQLGTIILTTDGWDVYR